MKRSNGETLRMMEQIARMRGLLDGLTTSVSLDVPISESAQAVADAGIRLVSTAARHDAYVMAEGDAYFKDEL